MPRRWRFPVAATLIVSALALSGVGCTSSRWDTSGIDDTVPTTAKRYPPTDAGITESLTDFLSTVGTDLDQWAAPKDQARCAAERLVRRLTTDHLLELGYDPKSPSLALGWSEDERTSVINILTGCIDMSQAILETYSSYQKLPLAESDCMAKGFDRLDLSRDLVAGIVDGKEPDPFANSDKFATGLASLAVECLSEDDLPPDGLMPKLPGGAASTSTTTTTTEPVDDGGLEGIEPGGPLDTTTTAPK